MPPWRPELSLSTAGGVDCRGGLPRPDSFLGSLLEPWCRRRSCLAAKLSVLRHLVVPLLLVLPPLPLSLQTPWPLPAFHTSSCLTCWALCSLGDTRGRLGHCPAPCAAEAWVHLGRAPARTQDAG